MINRRGSLFIAMLWIASVLCAQNNLSTEESMELLGADDETSSWEEELESLSHRLQEPLDLNTVTRKELEQLAFLSDSQIENLLAYRYIHGQLLTLSELQLVADMDKRTIDRLLPFVCVKLAPPQTRFPALRTLLKQGRQQVTTRLDVPFYTRKGYQSKYLGSPQYHSLKYAYHYGDYLQMGLTAEKDAGEPLFALSNRKGYDAYSFHFLLHDKGWLKTLALGDYRLSFGQGLVVNNRLSLGKTYSVTTTRQRAAGITKHSSTDEYNFFRGAALTFEVLRKVQLSGFYSYRRMDGTVKNDTLTTIAKTGLHRTEKEIAARNAFALQMAGGNVNYLSNRLSVGVTGIYYTFDRPYLPARKEYNRYNLRGNRFYNVGVDYRYHWKQLSLAGEAAKGKQGVACVNEASYRLSRDYLLTLVYRYYAYNYWALFARSFGESSTPQNENGWYLAAEASPMAHWRLFAGVDLYASPWWKYRISKPSQGVDVMCKALYMPDTRNSMYVTYRYRRKERDVTATGGKETTPTGQHQCRYRWEYAGNALQCRTTFDYTFFRQTGQASHTGYSCTELLTYSFHFPLKLSAQGSYFHADTYDARLYISESGLLDSFYSPSYYGRGFRCSARISYTLLKHCTLIAKFGETFYQDRETIGSGDDLIAGHTKTDLQMQLRVKF
ncbi:MAG: helix-hairpin-helix domain-containing protein [Mediterranea sp.]|jgi:hypothetical protein|nr:helix-hairpin-helix domain-containing protein [Mediterranea sp.]